jgi:hypothetical protein
VNRDERLDIYLRQVTGDKTVDGYYRLTPAQRRRLQHKDLKELRRIAEERDGEGA